MFRLIKLAFYCLLGYMLYEMWQGMSASTAGARGNQSRRRGGGSSSDLERALNEDTGRMMNMTGTGRGTIVASDDGVTGQSVPHVVGRGVVQP